CCSNPIIGSRQSSSDKFLALLESVFPTQVLSLGLLKLVASDDLESSEICTLLP
ncbi:hypothetical protein A2U01_0092433, partial [Trifolium medium]|nr:hypothetical protein [Trifolium medium]